MRRVERMRRSGGRLVRRTAAASAVAAAALLGSGLGNDRAAAAAGAAGGWSWPLGDGAPVPVARPFDPPAARYGAGHRGVDLAGAPGQPVRAAGAGRVSYAGLLAGRGVVVVVHGDLRTTYEPVRAEVAVGQQVAAGDVLGRLDAGHAGCPAPACLHWGLRRGERYLDPVRLLRAGPVRLLPLDERPAREPGPGPGPGGAPSSVGPAPVRSASGPAPDHELPDDGSPGLQLRRAATPTGGLAALCLLLGLWLLAGPRRPPPGGPAAAGPGAGVPAVDAPGAGAPAHGVGKAVTLDRPVAVPPPSAPARPVADLAAERRWRRAAG